MKNEEPRLLFNDPSRGIRVHTDLSNEIMACDGFEFSVAFITMDGLSTLYSAFDDLEKRGARGRILTTDYLGFNEPDALEWLLEKTGIEVRVCEERFHTKGYMFHHGDRASAFIGSSNLTAGALCVNLEWNVKVDTVPNERFFTELEDEFERMWSSAVPLTGEWIARYRESWARRSPEMPTIIEPSAPAPNEMQTEALRALDDIRSEGKRRALLISATGTGKTYLSAFDVKRFAPRRMLFLVHNETILKKALESYRAVLGDRYTYGLFTGSSKETECSALFSTIQTMVRNLDSFARDRFDYIVCDEAHHSTASTYSRIIGHFTPGFLLGMTATPERMDDGDVFRMFDYNVAYEIRLNKALEMGILCPFHYYGITDISVDGKPIDDDSDFNCLTSDERVRRIIEKSMFYRPPSGRTKGLIFCSRNDVARTLSEKMNALGCRTVALSKDDGIARRDEMIRRLRSDDGDCLDYILVRDIFNEGVDIPEVNQVIMLRPTESATIFIQQLGRGLRRTSDAGKALIVLDFIGNYTNNFLIPVALSGDRSHDKDAVRGFMINECLPGTSTVGFERIAKERILENLNRVNLSTLSRLKSEYMSMKVRLGRLPTLTDLLDGGSLDPSVLVRYGKGTNLNRFRAAIREDHLDLDAEEDRMLTMVSSFVDGKFPEELAIIRELLKSGEVSLDRFEDFDRESMETAAAVLSGSFYHLGPRSKSLVERDGDTIRRGSTLENLISVPGAERLIEDVVDCGLRINAERYADTDDLGFVKYAKYSRGDACRILNWKKDYSSTMYGYMISGGVCPLFVTYEKSDSISESTRYEEGFENSGLFWWMSKSSRTLDSDDVRSIIEGRVVLPLFLKKSDSEGTEFYYMGTVNPVKGEWREETIGGKSVVKMLLRLDEPAPDPLYRYMTCDTESGSPKDATARSQRLRYVGELKLQRLREVRDRHLDLVSYLPGAEVDPLEAFGGGVERDLHGPLETERRASSVNISRDLEQIRRSDHLDGLLVHAGGGLLQVQIAGHRDDEHVVAVVLGLRDQRLERLPGILAHGLRHLGSGERLVSVVVDLVRDPELVQMPHGIGLDVHGPPIGSDLFEQGLGANLRRYNTVLTFGYPEE